MEMDATQRRFLQGLVADRPAGRGSEVAAHFCRHFGLGVQVGARVEYRPSDFERAAQLLQTHGLPLTPLGTRADRAAAAAYPGMSEKSGTRSPHADSVAVKALGDCRLGGSPLQVPSRGYHVLGVEAALNISADRLMVVENLETFRAIDEYAWIATEGQRILVAFRGDACLSAADLNRLLASRPEPVWAFVDFDPAGLGIACRLPRLERVVLPPPAWLRRHAAGARAVELYERSQGQWQAVLDGTTHPAVRPHWELMRELRAGVPQERMSGLSGS